MRGGLVKVKHENPNLAKDQHIEVCLVWDVEGNRGTGLEKVTLRGGLADFTHTDIDISCSFLGKTLAFPLLIAPITGGGSKSTRINRVLAQAAEQLGIAMALGSQRPLMEGLTSPESYYVRDIAPSVPLLANLSLIQVKKGKDYISETIERIEADGILLYINPLHEILQVNGETDFRDCLDILASVAEDFPYPIFIKEVGFGLTPDVIEWASQNKISGVDVAGTGGTNWARIEGLVQVKDYSVYDGLGMPTLEAVRSARPVIREDQCLIASGGVRTGIDMAKCFALGADLVSMALPFLRWADGGLDDVIKGVEKLREQLIVSMWYCGSRNINQLKGHIS
jgi:isopentenyl-diphosphate Delta-isomerase